MRKIRWGAGGKQKITMLQGDPTREGTKQRGLRVKKKNRGRPRTIGCTDKEKPSIHGKKKEDTPTKKRKHQR